MISKLKSHASTIDTEGHGFPWKWVIIGVIVVSIAYAVYLIIKNLTGPATKLIDVFGGITRTLEDLSMACTPAPDCSKFSDCDACKNVSRCGCTSSASGGTSASTCANTDGTPPGQISGVQCAMNWLFIIGFGIAFLVLPIIKLFYRGKTTQAVKEVALNQNKSEEDVVKPLTNQAEADVEEAKKDAKSKGKELSEESIDILLKKSATTNLTREHLKAVGDDAAKRTSILDSYKEQNKAYTDYVDNLPEGEEKDTMSDAFKKIGEPTIEKYCNFCNNL